MNDEDIGGAGADDFAFRMTQVVEDERRRRPQPALQLERGRLTDDENSCLLYTSPSPRD